MASSSPEAFAPTTLSVPRPAEIITATPLPEPTPSPLPPTSSPTPSPQPSASPTPSPTTRPTAADPTAECPCGIEHVVVISVDGLRPDALEQADTPVLDALRARGAYSPVAQAVLPSVTLVNHASMLSGMSPAKHGILWNVNDPELGKVKGPTLFSVAHAAGLTTVMVVGKPKLEHLVLPGSVDQYLYAGFTDRQVVNEALEIIQTELPAVLFIHLPDVDSAGHALSWMSPGQLIAIGLTDSLIGELVMALEAGGELSQTLLIITADHGGQGRKHGGDTPAEMTIPWLAVGPGVPGGVTLQHDIVVYDTAATVLYALKLPLPKTWDGQPVLEIFDQPGRR